MDKELLKGTTPILILRLLESSDMYGYQIIKELEEKSENVFVLKEGTIYPILHMLERQGVIEAYWEDTQSLRKRKYYRITENGVKFLNEKMNEWFKYSNAVKNVFGGAVNER